ncbi:protein of unknown function [Nitrospira japonica]|uniref:Uncharacterized protein n=1 Tax=Nitrospira japonica TaxID=1325564 RepID=A0A1W1I5W2_9BACT|nr:protein of unknown function [Nitrospira japonica]
MPNSFKRFGKRQPQKLSGTLFDAIVLSNLLMFSPLPCNTTVTPRMHYVTVLTFTIRRPHAHRDYHLPRRVFRFKSSDSGVHRDYVGCRTHLRRL